MEYAPWSRLRWEGVLSMRIGDLAKKTRCSRDTLRFYEKMGLVQSRRGSGATNNYKHYDDQMIDRVLLVKQAKVLGFTLSEIKGIIVAWETNKLSRSEKARIFEDKIVLVEQRLAELRRVKRYLETKLKTLAQSS